MTDDIVKALREFNEERLNCEPWSCEQTAKEAADEIERLRAELAAERERGWKAHAANLSLAEDNEALRVELAVANVRLDDALRNKDIITDWYEKASAERDELREALKPFAEALDGNFAETQEDHVDLWESSHATVLTYGDLRRARAALTGDDRE